MIESRKHKFSSGAMSIIQMGEEQIGHPKTAMSELVKNAYDADASECYVYTQYDKEATRNFLIIKDNGLGMNSDTLFGNWLVTSRSSKRDEEKEKRRSLIFERRFLGSKGIGRLAAMALGRYLTVISRQNGEKKYNWLRIDRESFRVESLLDQVSFSGGQVDDFKELFENNTLLSENNLSQNGFLLNILSEKPFGDFNEGTVIILQDVDNSVQKIIEEEEKSEDIHETTFYKSLVDLITPLKLSDEIQKELVNKKFLREELRIHNGTGTFQVFFGSNFIKNQVKNQTEFIEVLPSKIIDRYDYRVFGKVSLDSEVTGRYICKRFEDDSKDEELLIEPSFLLSDENLPKRGTLKEENIPVKYQESEVGEFYFDMRIYDLDEDSKKNMIEILKAGNRREATQIMSRYLGIKISKNGFGVKPYGEEEQDWLGLGAQRVKKHIVTIGPNQILGYIFLTSPQNDGLKEKTNREGFFENREFIVFKKIITGILEETGRRRAKYRESHGLGRGKAKDKFERPDAEKFIQYLALKISDPEVIRLSEEFVAKSNAVLDNMQETLTLSERLATLGTGLELVYHELAQPITAIGGSVASLEIYNKKIQEDFLNKTFKEITANIDGSINTIGELKESLRPAIGKSRPKIFKPIDTFVKVIRLFKDKIDENSITITISSNLNNYKINELEYPLWVSFLNIINNAIYWLKFADKEKIINFQLSDNEVLSISNTGPKILDDELEVIFQYGITGKKERDATGLGLAFSRNILRRIDWEVWAENDTIGPVFFIKKI